eukprot:m.457574 g.457574  ORF g.457574 m.457574 type:complete len:153 (+) comp21296_c0_seq1:45-503(+)
MSEPLLTYVMPLSVTILAGAVGKAIVDGGDAIPIWEAASLFFWLWSAKNIAVGPLKKDAGIVTFFAGAAAAVAHQGFGAHVPNWIGAVASGLVTLNFGGAFAFLATSGVDKAFARFAKMGKSKLWTSIFYYYCAVSTVAWGALTWVIMDKRN